MGLRGVLKAGVVLFGVATVTYAVRSQKSHGTFAKVPFDFRVPSLKKLRDRLWNPDDPSFITPSAFGIGWGPNAYQLLKRVRRTADRADSAGDSQEPEA